MILKTVIYMCIILAATNVLSVAAGLSTNELSVLRITLKDATSKTKGLFEAGASPSRHEPSFDALQNMLSLKYVANFTNMLMVCENSEEKKVLLYALQTLSPNDYMLLLEQVPDALSAHKIDLQDCFTLLFPQGNIEGIVPYNYQNTRMATMISKLKNIIQSIECDSKQKGNILYAISLVQSGDMKKAFIGVRSEKHISKPLPVLTQ